MPIKVTFQWEHDFINQYIRNEIYHDKYEVKVFVNKPPWGIKLKHQKWIVLQIESRAVIGNQRIYNIMNNSKNVDAFLVFDKELLTLPHSILTTPYS